MGRYSDTNVEKSAILLLKIEQNGGFLELLSHYIKEWLYFETDFSFKIPLVCSSKWIHEITYSLFFIFWRQVCDVICPLKSSNSKTYDKHTICKNDMFYVHGKFSRNGMTIKEIEAYWRFCIHFRQSSMT